jgi:hypothetical protein
MLSDEKIIEIAKKLGIFKQQAAIKFARAILKAAVEDCKPYDTDQLMVLMRDDHIGYDSGFVRKSDLIEEADHE